MSDDKVKRRVYLLANPDKPEAARAMRSAENFQVESIEIVGSAVGLDATDAVKAGVDRLIVFGGDGTLIGVARSLGANHLPLVGVNIAKHGFLAEISPDE